MDARGPRPLTVAALVATTIAWLGSIVFSVTGHVSQGLVLLGLAAVAMAVAWLSTTRRDEPATRASGPKRTIVVRNASPAADAAAPTPEEAAQPGDVETEDAEAEYAEPEDVEIEDAEPEDVEIEDVEPEDVEIEDVEPEDVEIEDVEPEVAEEPAPGAEYAPN